MNERITKQMVEDGLWQDVIKIRFEDMNEFIVTIGDNWFYSGGQDSDWRSASSIFDLIADGIFETLEGFRDGWDFYGDEYLYYYYYPERAYKNIVSGKETRGELIARVNKAMTEELSLIDVEKDFDKALAVYGRYYGERERMYMANETGIARGIPWSFDPMSRDEGGYAGVALRYIEIISTGRPQTMILCVPADGAVPFAEKGDVVEITADITADAVIPHRFDEIPEVNLKLLRRVKEYERRAARGILSRNKSEIIEALKCNPLVASDTISRQLADTYIEYDKEFGGVWED